MTEGHGLRTVELVKHFSGSRKGATVRAVDGVSLDVPAGSSLALVGESGCGKTTLIRTIVGLYRPDSGAILVGSQDLSIPAALRRNRRALQFVPQNPLSAFNRRRTIGHALTQALAVYHKEFALTRSARRIRAAEMLDRVGLTVSYLDRLPMEVSVGELQRIAIARALILEPAVLLLDEPTASLDVTTKVRLINLMLELRETTGITTLVVTHEMDLARHLGDRIAVMYAGKVVENGTTDQILTAPEHPYTQLLIDSINPSRGARPTRKPPAESVATTGCAFSPRCGQAMERCTAEPPRLLTLAGRAIACYAVESARQSAGSQAGSGALGVGPDSNQ
jgi:oligopeptide/dipeptide ABC transporter ATP-binding protein